MDLRDFNPAVKYGAKLQNSSLDSGKILVGDSSNLSQEVTPSGDISMTAAGVVTGTQGSHFIATASVGTVSIQTGVTVLADASVTSSRSVYLEGFVIKNNSTTAWATGSGSTFVIEDSSGTPFYTITNGFAASAIMNISSGSVTSENAFAQGSGSTPSKGIRVKTATGMTPSAGSVFTVTVWGVIK